MKEWPLYTGYYARIRDYRKADLLLVPVSLSLPKWFTDAGHDRTMLWLRRTFAPTVSIRQIAVTTPEGRARYRELYEDYLIEEKMASGLEQIYRSLNGSHYKGAVLLCYEAPDKFCHRHLLAAKLSTHIQRQIANGRRVNFQPKITEYARNQNSTRAQRALFE
jgi:hypothetical protein